MFDVGSQLCLHPRTTQVGLVVRECVTASPRHMCSHAHRPLPQASLHSFRKAFILIPGLEKRPLFFQQPRPPKHTCKQAGGPFLFCSPPPFRLSAAIPVA